MTDLTSAVERMQAHYARPHALPSPVAARRKATDSPAPAPLDPFNELDRTTQRIARPGTNRNASYRPRAADFAGRDPATSRPAFGSVKPSGGRRIGNDHDQARADSENAARSAWVSARSAIERESGDVLEAGLHYPSAITAKGNLGPSARY